MVLYDASNGTARRRLDSLPDTVGEPGVARPNRWQIVCETHGQIVRTETARQAGLDSLKGLASYPVAVAGCCPGCLDAWRSTQVQALAGAFQVTVEERGRGGTTSLSIILRHRYSHRIIHSWEGEVARGLVDTGDFDPRRWTLSVLEYARRVGVISVLP